MIRFSFIIPTYNRSDSLLDLLESINSMDSNGCPFELIVINDGSTDGTELVITNWKCSNEYVDFKFVTIPNGGPAKARNHGSALATGVWLIFIDDDCVLPKNYLTSLDHSIGLEKECSAICGNIIGFNQSFLSRYIDWTGLMQSPNDSSNGKLYFLTANAIVDRILFMRLGGFNTSFRYASGEDVFLSDMIRKSGHSILFFKDCFIWHKHRDTITGIFKTCNLYGLGHFQLELSCGKHYRRNLIRNLVGEFIHSSKKVYRSNALRYGMFYVFLDLLKVLAWTKGYNYAFDAFRHDQSELK